MGVGSHVATASVVVDPRRHNRGVGRGLGHEVIDWAHLRAERCRPDRRPVLAPSGAYSGTQNGTYGVSS